VETAAVSDGAKERLSACLKHFHSCAIRAGPGWDSAVWEEHRGWETRGSQCAHVLCLIYMTLS
jgi:hypothetical protein